jgi:hypothetical protein
VISNTVECRAQSFHLFLLAYMVAC